MSGRAYKRVAEQTTEDHGYPPDEPTRQDTVFADVEATLIRARESNLAAQQQETQQ